MENREKAVRDLVRGQWDAMIETLYGAEGQRGLCTEEKADRIAIHATYGLVVELRVALDALNNRLIEIERRTTAMEGEARHARR